jgi:hypothetical protein
MFYFIYFSFYFKFSRIYLFLCFSFILFIIIYYIQVFNFLLKL